MKKFITTILIIILIIIFIAGGLYFWFKKEIKKPASSDSTLIEVEIDKGESVKDIALKLERAEIISNSDIFYFYVKFNNLGSEIQAGKFTLPKNLTMEEVANYLQKASGNDIWITIPEGLRSDEIADLLDREFLKA